MFQHHDIAITDMDQPLLMSLPSKREQRAGQEGPIYLLPEICYMTG